MVFASTLQLSLVELISVDENLTQSMLKDPLSEEEDRTTDSDELDEKLLLNSNVDYAIQIKVSKQNFNISNDQTYYSGLIKIQVPPPKHTA
jgi:hypothetical protein